MMTALNLKLIQDPVATVGSREFNEYVTEEPSLKALHPLARACASTAYAIPGMDTRAIRLLRRSALKTCWLIGEMPIKKDGDTYILEEAVSHFLEKQIGKTKLSLEFAARGNAFFCSRQEKIFHAARLDRLEADWDDKSEAPLITYWNKNAASKPTSYPNDSGDQIGGFSSELVRINGLTVAGPTFTDNGVEQIWDGIVPQTGSDSEEDDGRNAFCLFEFLPFEGAEKLGIASAGFPVGKNATQPEQGVLPDWVPLDLRCDEAWVTSAEIEESFLGGVVGLETHKKTRLVVAPDQNWNPLYAVEDPILSIPFSIGHKSCQAVERLLSRFATMTHLAH